MQYKDYYAILGVPRDASTADITKAYRKLAHKYHPDVSGDKATEEKFKEVAEAYKTLKDAEKRQAYDQLGQHAPGEDIRPPPDWQQQHSQGPFNPEDLDLSELFAHLRTGRGGARPGAGAHAGAQTPQWPGEDYDVPVQISIEDAFHGTEIELSLRMPEYDASGAGRMVPHTVKARIPKGATDGQRLRLRGKGGPGFGGGRAGDLFLDITLRPHTLFRARGHDLFLDLPLAPWEAVLGTTVEVPAPGGAVRLKIAPGTLAGRQLRLAGRGLPKPHGEPGDLYAIVQIVVPAASSAAEQAAYRTLAETSGFQPRAHFATESSNAH
ncbi:MAG: DnaJ C-terminal domain-containing protein [Steroidobacteraceae bacterium]